MGVEMQLGLDVTSWLSLAANTAISRNKLKDFDEVVEDWDNGTKTIHYDNATLAFSPSYITNVFANLHYQGFQAVWHTGMVSRQYLDNTENKARSLPSYEVSNLNLSYTLKGGRNQASGSWNKWFRETVFSLSLNNIFNKRYAQSGWVYSAIYESGGHPDDNRYYQIGFIPAAGFTIQGGITVKF
jgi:iron complex outermembrane receptor protein